MLNCPRCFDIDCVTRSNWRWWERPIAILLVRPYRCQECGTRFWRVRWKPVLKKKPDGKASPSKGDA